MPQPDEPRDEALASLDQRLAAAEAKRPQVGAATAAKAMGQGYRFLSEVVGGVLGGLGFGWLLDHFANTRPFGLICGLLIGIGVSTFVAVRGAARRAKAASGLAGGSPSAPGAEDD
ncbi:MAG TPA: AtpZ/AtpI family protein [Phenylobacterium sp.]|jgi:ATP synthase protein I|nr:AtpZ/AtpI family protein [Phenylobacterium sp.]